MPPLGKKELLLWAAETSGIRPCEKYADLRDGVVLLTLACRLFNTNVDLKNLRRGPVDIEKNWDTLRRVMQQNHLPLHLCDRNAVAAGHARHCFNMLVLFYFLTRLSNDSEFCVDFANPIDTVIASFLQSPESLRCIGKIPVIKDDEVKTTTSFSRNLTEIKEQQPLSQEYYNNINHQLQIHNQQQEQQKQKEKEELKLELESEKYLHILPPTKSLDSSSKLEYSVEKEEENNKKDIEIKLQRLRISNAQLQEELNHVKATSQLMLAQQRSLVASELSRMTEQFEVQLAMIRLERDHEIRQCLLNVREEYNNFLNETVNEDIEKEEEEYEERRGGSQNRITSSSSSSSSSTIIRALQGKLNSFEREIIESKDTIQQLRLAITTQSEHHDTFTKKIQSICTSTPPISNDDISFIESITSSLEVESEAIKNTIALRLKTILSQMKVLHSDSERLKDKLEVEVIPTVVSTTANTNTNNTRKCINSSNSTNSIEETTEVSRLRMQVERLKQTNQFLRYQRQKSLENQNQNQNQQQQQDWHAIPLSDGLEAPSCVINSETCDTICARASALVESQTIDKFPVIRDELQRLITVVQILQVRIQTASDALIIYRDKNQSLYEELLTAQQSGEFMANERQREMELKFDEYRLRMETNEASLISKLRLSEERSMRRESIAQTLHQRVREMVSGFIKQTNFNDNESMKGIQEVIKQLMEDLTDSQRKHDSLEAALSELSGEVAKLRQELAQRERESKRLQTSLETAEMARHMGISEVIKIKKEVKKLNDAMNIEIDAFHRFIERVAELLSIDTPPPLKILNQRVKSEKSPLVSNISENIPIDQSYYYLNQKDNDDDIGNKNDIIRINNNKKEEEEYENNKKESEIEIEKTTKVNSIPLLLSSEELERRKMAILSKYGFSTRVEH